MRRRALLGYVDKKDCDFRVIDLTRNLMPWDILVETPEGLPAAGASVQIDPTSMDYKLPAMQADRTGRIRVLLPREGPLGFIIHHESGSLVYSGVAKSTSSDVPERVPVWRARLDKGMVVRGKVTDNQGKPRGWSQHLGPPRPSVSIAARRRGVRFRHGAGHGDTRTPR